MDIVLEATDKYVFDSIYATLFPVPAAVHSVIQASVPSSELFEVLLKNLSLSYIPAEPYEFTLFPPGQEAYLSTVARSNVYRQTLSLFLITWFFGVALYFFFASLSFFFIFDKRSMEHPKFLKNQIRLEIHQALTAMPLMSLLTVPWFLAEIHGYGKLYWDPLEYGKKYLYLQYPLFIAFTDFGIYPIHRGLHHPLLYKRLHKPHHKWIVPTPFASHAFHPVDGYLQSLPYHFFPFIFPLHKLAYLILFSFINIWTILIHDGEYITQNPAINGSACHTIHHLYFNYNYGQFTTLWDRIGNSYRLPDKTLLDREQKMSKSTWKNQSKEVETIVKDVELDDDRTYDHEDISAQEEKKEK
ncbi:uncharacterized protein V2V93DRAFT_369597 [Kockiozyma suomiensis]|uniref:uncharacterized protein n=1 Tax=Kockiozyma suomiensis TaxID=1337062 RepID=UPI003343217C